MKLTKKLESEILKVYNACWNAYLAGDIKTHASFLSPGFKIIGTSESEQFDSKRAWIAYCKKTIKQFAGVIKLKKRQIELVPAGEEVMVVENSHIYVLIEGKWTFYSNIRISALLQNTKTGWKYIYQHGSLPDAKANEGEVIATEQIKAENLQLRDAVKRRTIELEQKNRDLEIESSLERVRAIAMGMRKPDDLLTVCEILFSELQALGFAELRNTMINIFDDEKGSFLNYDYSAHAGKTIANLFYNTHPVIEKQIQQARTSEDAFSEAIFAGKDLEDWKEFRKRGGEADDPRVNDINALYYNFYSIGTGVIGISSYNSVTEEKRDVLKRFRNVFDLAYRRFMDIQQAEAQAREAKIEAALERTRTQSMLMQHSKELDDTLRVFHEQVLLLGIHSAFSFLWLPDEEKDRHIFWAAWAENNSTIFKSKAINYSLDRNEPATAQCLIDWKSKEPVYSYAVPPDGVENYFAAWKELIEGVEKLTPEHFSGGLYYVEAFMKYGCFGVMVATDLREDEKNILGRFAVEFERTYTRFLDLQKAEEQARESQIQLALERVRARTMAMHNSEDVTSATETMFNELKKLGIDNLRCGIANIHLNKTFDVFGVTNLTRGNTMSGFGLFGMDEHPIWQRWFESWKNKEEVFIAYIAGQEKEEYFNNINIHRNYLPQQIINFPDSFFQAYYFEQGAVWVYSLLKHSEPEKDILKRFATGFSLTFRRYQDLKKAEAQAKEAQIEAALERVRSRSMGMQKSEELKEVIQVVYEQFVHLNILVEHTGFIMDYKARDDMNIWLADQHEVPSQVTIPYFDCAHWNSFNEAKEKGKDFFANHLAFEEKNRFYQDLFKLFPVPEEAKEYYFSCPGLAISTVLLENVGLYIENFSGIPYTDEENALLMRFGKVFQQTYTRFLDLQKAEAQAREAQIEAALERVRSRTMGMQQSHELGDVATVLFKELNHLVENLWTCGFVLCEKDRGEDEWWLSTGDGFIPAFYLPNTGDPTHANIYDAWKNGETYHTEQLEGEGLQQHYDWLMNIPVSKNIFDDMKAAGNSLPAWQKLHCAYFSYGYLVMITQVPCPEEQVFKRFAQVFDQTYTRFLDLKKAEAQAREAQIEAALERVRSRTMAMQRSEELADAATVLFQQVKALGVPQWTCGFSIFEIDDKEFTWYPGGPGGEILPPSKIPLMEHPVFIQFNESRKRGDELYIYEKTGEVQADHYRYMLSLPVVGKYLQSRIAAGEEFPTFQIDHLANFSHGNLIFITYEHFPEMHDIFKRFAKVFEQTYTRFLDLQKAEAQAREAKIEAALERVRARSMAMHKSEELADLSLELVKQVQALGVATWFCAFNIYDDDPQGSLEWGSNGQGTFPRYRTPREGIFRRYYEVGQSGETFLINEIGENECAAHYEYLCSLPGVGEQLLKMKAAGIPFPAFQIDHVAFFKYGYILFITYEEVPESHDIFKRFAKVFEQTYTRFLDLQKAEAQAREANIEAALEKVRSRSLAMHKSDEIKEVVKTVVEKIKELDIEMNGGVSLVTFSPGSKDLLHWIWIPEQFDEPLKAALPYFDNIMFHDCNEGREKGFELVARVYSGEEKRNYFEHIFNRSGFSVATDDLKSWVMGQEYFGFSFAIQQHSGIFLNDYTGKYFSDETNDILIRFSKVFEQSYIRFLDLQKSEAQTREAQIELSLERVRAKTMAMHNSADVGETVATMFDELVHLGVVTNRCGVLVIDETKHMEVWTAKSNPGGQVNMIIGRLNMMIHPLLQGAYNAWKSKQSTFEYQMAGDDLKEYYKVINSSPDYPVRFDLESLPPKQVHADFFFPEGALFAFTDEPLSKEAAQIFKRFAGVFGQTYRRFLDLQKAEAQAREAQIQLALERVRARTMAMHKSDELPETSHILFEQMKELGEPVEQLTIGIVNEENNVIEISATLLGDTLKKIYCHSIDEPYMMAKIYKAWKKQQKTLVVELRGDELNAYNQYRNELTNSKIFPTDLGKEQQRIVYAAFFSKGMLALGANETRPPESLQLLVKFASVFDLTYTRFLDLQKAEAQAREAQIEASLERVRARTMAMHNSEDVSVATATMFIELEKLGIENFRGGILNIKENKTMDVWSVNKSADSDPHDPVGRGKTIRAAGQWDMTLHPWWRELYKGWINKA